MPATRTPRWVEFTAQAPRPAGPGPPVVGPGPQAPPPHQAVAPGQLAVTPGQRTARPVADPVFVDRSGRRRRAAKLIGVCFAVVLTASLAVLVAGLIGATPGGLPGLPSDGDGAQPVLTPGPRGGTSADGEPTPVTQGNLGVSASASGPSASPDRTNNGKRPTDLPTHSRPPKP